MLRFYVLLVALFRAYGELLYANLGDNVTLPCHYASDAKYLCWYKQVVGEQPQIMWSFYKHSPDSNSFLNQFKGNKRLSVHTGEGFCHLNISNVQDSDSAMYFCGQTSITITEFDRGTFLVLKESSHSISLQQPESNSAQPGDSVTLNCTVFSGSSDGEHSVYWFKKDSANSQLGIMHIHTSSSSQCVQSSESGRSTQSCVYSLSKRMVSLSDVGTYYCAVASCREILLGKGTRLSFKENPYKTLIVVIAALVVSVILNIILFGIFCKTAQRKYLHSEGSEQHLGTPEYTADTQNEACTAVQYATLDFRKKKGASRRQRNMEEATIYSGVRME